MHGGESGLGVAGVSVRVRTCAHREGKRSETENSGAHADRWVRDVARAGPFGI